MARGGRPWGSKSRRPAPRHCLDGRTPSDDTGLRAHATPSASPRTREVCRAIGGEYWKMQDAIRDPPSFCDWLLALSDF